MNVSKEEFRKKLMYLQGKKRAAKEREYSIYLAGAVQRMKPRKGGRKFKGIINFS